MTTSDSGYVSPQSRDKSSMSIEVLPNLYEELGRVDKATKRLSLTEKCPTCGQHVPGPARSPFRNSVQSVKEVDLATDSKTLEAPAEVVEEEKTARGLRFWLIIVALVVVGAVTALEGTIVGTALPTSKSESTPSS
jgi:endogenous inhibitor of DNA gyrase (YacG/DUF329 family)